MLNNFCKIPKFYTQSLSLPAIVACYDFMDQTGLLQVKQAFESDLEHNICTENGVIFATVRIQIIDGILEEREEKFKVGQALLSKEE